MASAALLLYFLIAIFDIVGSVQVSPPPSLHQGGNRTEAILQPVSWFPATSFKDPCNATEPPESAVIGPLDDSVCGGVSKRQTFFFLTILIDLGGTWSENLRLCGKYWDSRVRLPQVD